MDRLYPYPLEKEGRRNACKEFKPHVERVMQKSVGRYDQKQKYDKLYEPTKKENKTNSMG